MKVLTATTQGQGDRPGDFNAAVPGELVFLWIICGRDESDPANGPCGCGRAFTGVASGKATTTAIVAELDATPNTLADIVTEQLRARGWDIDPEDLADLAHDLAHDAEPYPVGTVLRRVGDDLEPN